MFYFHLSVHAMDGHGFRERFHFVCKDSGS
jgi:hypothetical protein